MLKIILKRISVALAFKKGIWMFSVSSLFVVLLEFPAYNLRVIEATGGRELAAVRVSPGDWLKVEYVHSIYKVKQSEVFKIGSDLCFYLEKVTFGSYAAAAYYDPNPPKGFTFKDSLWTVNGGGKKYSVLKYRASSTSGHILTLKDRTVDLSTNAMRSGELIEVCLEREGKH